MPVRWVWGEHGDELLDAKTNEEVMWTSGGFLNFKTEQDKRLIQMAPALLSRLKRMRGEMETLLDAHAAALAEDFGHATIAAIQREVHEVNVLMAVIEEGA